MKHTNKWFIPLVVAIMLVMLSCNFLTGATPTPIQPSVQGSAVPVPVGEISTPVTPPVDTPSTPGGKTEPLRGPGDFDLKQPTLGLDSLPSYSQRYVKSFEGKKDGADYAYSTVITHTMILQAAQELSALQTVAQDGAPVQIWVAKIGEASYYQSGSDIPCQGMASAEQVDSGLVPDPASLLPLVFGAEQSGEETLNGVDTVRYTFDERSLSRYRSSKASGSVWVAKVGGWVVKYLLEATSPKDVAGAGLEGKQTWLYEVTDVGTLSNIALPADCYPVLLDFPVSPGAQEVERMSGSVHYFTSESIDEVSSFYREQLSGQGWKEKEMFASTTEKGMLTFVLPEGSKEKVVSVVIRPSGDQTEVIVALFEEELPPPATATP